MTGGDVGRGRALFANAGCGACYQLSEVPEARGRVGPPLDGVAARAVIAGRLADNPDISPAGSPTRRRCRPAPPCRASASPPNRRSTSPPSSMRSHNLLILSALLGSCSHAGAIAPLRVCADPNNLPLSNQRGEGLENKLAELIAEELHRPLDYVWWAQRRGNVRESSMPANAT